MGRGPRIDFPGAIAHLIARGNQRQNIFFTDSDWEFFLNLLGDLKARRPFRLYAYCLMSNHIHLLVETIQFPITRLMQLLLGRYAKYLNLRLNRSGHVFQGRFKSLLCNRDSYFQQLVRYIHLNPVKAEIVKEPSAWPYSGHLEYMGKDSRGLIDADLLLSSLAEDIQSARDAYLRFIADGMSKNGNHLDSLWQDIRMISKPPMRALEIRIDDARPPLEKLIASVAAEAAVPFELIRSSTKVPSISKARHTFIRNAFQAGYSPTEIATYLFITLSAVSKCLIQQS